MQHRRTLIAAAITGALSLVLWLLISRMLAALPVTITLGSRTLDFIAPKWLYLLALLPWIFFAQRFSLTDLATSQRWLGSVFRALVFAALTLALARPSSVSQSSKVATVVLVDVSASMSDAELTAAKQKFEQIKLAQPNDADLFLITFAQKPKVVRNVDVAQIVRHEGEPAGSDLQAALRLSYGLFPPGSLARVVILSDGIQTAGDLTAEASAAAKLGVKISWQEIPEDAEIEVRLVGITTPDEVKLGAPFSARTQIMSTKAQSADVALTLNGAPNPTEPKKNVQLVEGINWVDFKVEAKEIGETTLRAQVTASLDKESANNAGSATVFVKGKPRVLYVEGGVTRDPSIAGHFKRGLEQENIEVEVVGPRGLPSSAKALEKYDLVAVSDVPATFMSLGQMQALENYLKDFGGGVLVAGGEDSFGSGGYQGTTIERIMPVRFDSERQLDQPQIAMALVIDRSGSMSGAKLEAAKESARATAEVLSAGDLITVIAFDSQPSTLVRLQRAANRMRISTDISRLQAGGGTNVYPALQEAYSVLQSANAKVKHVIVLSDGEFPADGIAELCQEMRASRITASAVGIGDANRNLLSLISDNADGRLYMTDESSLPRIFLKETSEVQRSSLVEDVVYPRVIKRVEMIEGTGVEGAPALRGYVATKPKPGGEVIIASDKGEPLLARWRVGTGTSVAWTSDVKNRWASNWILWNNYPKFWAQVARSSMRRKMYDSYQMSAEVRDNRAYVVVDALDASDRFVNSLDTTLEIIDPILKKPVLTVPMQQVAPGRYAADVPVTQYGSFLLKAVHSRDGQKVAESVGSVSLSYPLEYLRATPDTQVLTQAAAMTDGRDNPQPNEVFSADGESIAHHKEVWPWFLLAGLGLWVFDVFLRRVRLFGYRTIEFGK